MKSGRGRGCRGGRGRGQVGRPAKKRGRGRPRKRKITVTEPVPAAEAASATQTDETATLHWPIVKPAVFELLNPAAPSRRFKPFAFTDRRKHDAKFVLPTPSPDPSDVPGVVLALNSCYYPEKFMTNIWCRTLQYVDAKKLPSCKRYKIHVADIYQFFAIVNYMGVVRLPAKRDYWCVKDLDLMPEHPVCTARKMSFRKFVFLFKHIYAVEPEIDEPSDVIDEVIVPTERPDIVPSLGEDDLGDTPSSDEDEPDAAFAFERKASPFMNQFNETNKLICRRPSSSMVGDEMMSRFKGRSPDTYRMKCKPISEGYKFFAIACSQSTFVWHMVPYGRVNTKVGIIDTVKTLVDTLPDRGTVNYLLALDNYFTYDRAIDYCVDNGVHVVGTAKVKKGWPPAALTAIKEKRFNFLHYVKSNSGKFNIFRWVDNGVVYMVSSCHNPKATVLVARKRPRVTQKNKVNVREVWGNEWVRDIKIPAFVHSYNDGKTGVDGSDQLISYYLPNFRMRRTWMPIMMHATYASRANAFAHHRGYCGKDAVTSKSFILMWIRSFMSRAKRCERYATRAASSYVDIKRVKRHRMSNKKPTLPDKRFDDTLAHVPILTTTQSACYMCRFVKAWKKLMHPDWTQAQLPNVSRPKKKCLGCDEHLCDRCFCPFHTIPKPDWENWMS